MNLAPTETTTPPNTPANESVLTENMQRLTLSTSSSTTFRKQLLKYLDGTNQREALQYLITFADQQAPFELAIFLYVYMQQPASAISQELLAKCLFSACYKVFNMDVIHGSWKALQNLFEQAPQNAQLAELLRKKAADRTTPVPVDEDFTFEFWNAFSNALALRTKIDTSEFKKLFSPIASSRFDDPNMHSPYCLQTALFIGSMILEPQISCLDAELLLLEYSCQEFLVELICSCKQRVKICELIKHLNYLYCNEGSTDKHPLLRRLSDLALESIQELLHKITPTDATIYLEIAPELCLGLLHNPNCNDERKRAITKQILMLQQELSLKFLSKFFKTEVAKECTDILVTKPWVMSTLHGIEDPATMDTSLYAHIQELLADCPFEPPKAVYKCIQALEKALKWYIDQDEEDLFFLEGSHKEYRKKIQNLVKASCDSVLLKLKLG